VAPTGSIAGLLRDQGVVAPIAVVPTGINTARFASGAGAGFRKRHGIPAGAFVVGHLGRLVPAKRIAFLVESIVAFLAGAPDAVALICGEGEMAAPLAEAFETAGLSDRLHLLGRLDEGEIADAYAAMDVFTFASLTDTQGLVLAEAMAAGVPVLALRATGPQDVVVDGVSGRLLEPTATPADFARALADFRDAPDRPRFASEARRRSLDYDRRTCAGALLAVYDKAAATSRDRTRDPRDRDLAGLHDRVEAAWLRFADRPAASQALLPTRGFPLFTDPA
jgi:glycosyltransferase involved in cell wall biosynthesis